MLSETKGTNRIKSVEERRRKEERVMIKLCYSRKVHTKLLQRSLFRNTVTIISINSVDFFFLFLLNL